MKFVVWKDYLWQLGCTAYILLRFNISHIVFPSDDGNINEDVHKPAQAPYLVVVVDEVIEYVEKKYKYSGKLYWKMAGQRRMVPRNSKS